MKHLESCLADKSINIAIVVKLMVMMDQLNTVVHTVPSIHLFVQQNFRLFGSFEGR